VDLRGAGREILTHSSSDNGRNRGRIERHSTAAMDSQRQRRPSPPAAVVLNAASILSALERGRDSADARGSRTGSEMHPFYRVLKVRMVGRRDASLQLR
jgi:hypothetical protein